MEAQRGACARADVINGELSAAGNTICAKKRHKDLPPIGTPGKAQGNQTKLKGLHFLRAANALTRTCNLLNGVSRTVNAYL